MIPPMLQNLLDENKWDDAITFLNSINISLNDELQERLAWCYSRTERYSEAIAIYDVLLQRQPENAKWQYSKGYQYYAQKDYLQAVQYFEKALEFYPNYFKVKYRLAYAYLQLAGIEKQWTKDVFWKAIKQLNDAHDIFKQYTPVEREKNKSTYADICALHGKTIANSAKYLDKAIELLKCSLDLKQDDDVKYQLAKAYYAKKDYSQALKELPQNNRLPYYVSELKSQILADSNQIDEANNILLNLLRFRRKDYLYQRLAYNYLAIANLEKALDYALLAVKTDFRNYKNYLICGQVYMAQKQYKTAINYFEQSRTKKQTQYHTDVPEAVAFIDEIMKITQNSPTDTKPNLSLRNEDDNIKKLGRIIKYNNERGFGFVKDETSGMDYFFHISQFDKSQLPEINLLVKFETAKTNKGEQAIKLEYVEQSSN